MMTKTVSMECSVNVTVDESKFTPEFMEEFRKYFYDFDTVDDHIAHLAQLVIRGLVNQHSAFIEGYGKPDSMGIKFSKPEYL